MENQGLRTTYLICFGGAIALFAVLLAPTIFGSFAINHKILVGVAAVLLLIAGITARQVFAEQIRLLRDETEREHELAERLHEQQQAVDALAEGLAVAIFICDARGQILYANRKAEELFRFDSPVGRTILAVTISYDLEQLVQRVIATRARERAELTFTYPEERLAIAESWPDPAGTKAFVSIYDITALRKLERIRTDFVANVSHELRTPLATIRAMAETLEDSDEPELLKRYLAKIISEVDRLSSITQDLLILSAAESNPVRRLDCDIAEVFRSVKNQLEHKAKSKSLVMKFEGPDSLVIPANATQMTQVAMNLIDNAINYTTEGEITVSVTPLERTVRIDVTDTGLGIPSDQVDRIFERFYRVDKGRSRATGGTGLGLSIVKHIVEAHGGTITLDTTLGKGSTFIVELPLPQVTPSSGQD